MGEECSVSVCKALGSTKKGEGKHSYLSHGNFRADPWEVRPGDGQSRDRRLRRMEQHIPGENGFYGVGMGRGKGEMRNRTREVSRLYGAEQPCRGFSLSAQRISTGSKQPGMP